MALNKFWPTAGLGQVDDLDYYGTFGPAETRSLSGQEVETIGVVDGGKTVGDGKVI
jgi:hypothetical protein